jgi:hypothetical protein
MGDGAGVLHQIADAYDIADHRHRRLERRAGAALRHRRVGREAVEERAVVVADLSRSGEGGESQCEERQHGEADHRSSPQRIIADVDCSI